MASNKYNQEDVLELLDDVSIPTEGILDEEFDVRF